MPESPDKLLVVGFDGLDHELFARHNALDLDVHPLYAPIPVTGPSWTSLYTGDSMTTHNVRDVYGLEFRRRYARNDVLHLLRWRLHNLGRVLRGKPAHKRYATYATTPSTHVWDTLGEAGVRVKIVNMPITCPVRPVHGVHVGGFPLIRRGRWYWPDEIGERIPDEYVDWVDITHWFQDPERDSHRQWRRELTKMGFDEGRRRAGEAADRLAGMFLSLPEARLEMVQFSFIDRFGHVFGVDGEVERWCYAKVGELLGRLIDAADPAGVLVISDHGFQGDGHTDYGVLAAGRAMRDRLRVPDDYTPSVLDVAPTIAAWFGATHDCEGNNLLAEGDYVTRDAEQDAAEKAEITKRLKNLGYL